MATLAEVKKKAAYKLFATTVGQALSAAVDAQMSQAYLETYDELEELDLVTWTDTDDIPDKVADYVADIMAWKRADIYATPEIAASCEKRYMMAERNIKRMMVPKNVELDEPEDF